MIAVARPPAGPARAVAVLGCAAGWVLQLALDLLRGLAALLQPAFWAGLALALAAALGRGLVGMGQPAAAGFVVGVLAVCIVAGLLAWAERRHRWWSR